MLKRFKSHWHPSIKWKRIGLVGLLTGIPFLAVIIIDVGSQKATPNGSAGDLIISLYLFFLWLGLTYVCSIVFGGIDITKPLFKERGVQ